MKKILKSTVSKGRKNICVRFSCKEREEAQRKADEYCDGKLSEWIREAALNWNPNDDEDVIYVDE